jgi:deoxyuridine 5'-triphosphate nucleotidohydrolase
MSGENDAIDEDFFATIDTPLKSYILAVIALNTSTPEVITPEVITPTVVTPTVITPTVVTPTVVTPTVVTPTVLKLNNIKDHDNNMRSVSYGYYCDLNDNDKKNYPYFNNIDRLVGYLRKIGSVKYTEDAFLTGTLELTPLSSYSQKIKEEIANIKSAGGDMLAFITKCHSEDVNKCNQFVKAYIEKYGNIINDHLNITFYDDKMAESIAKLYDIPHNILKGVNNLVIQYKGVNMIDLLGMLYSDYECPYYNNYIYTYNSRDSGAGVPTIKVFKVDERAVIPSKSRYSDSGYDLTIISEYKRLTSNTVIYDTGIQLEIPNGYYVEIVPRSSISRSGYMLANNVGIIDQGYRGNLYIALTKINGETPDLTDLTEWRLPWKCCQMIVKKQIYSRLVITDMVAERAERAANADTISVIEKSSRGTGAFGSTG